jgi:hypothetical protein
VSGRQNSSFTGRARSLRAIVKVISIGIGVGRHTLRADDLEVHRKFLVELANGEVIARTVDGNW